MTEVSVPDPTLEDSSAVDRDTRVPSIYGREDKSSLINMVSERFRDAMLDVPEELMDKTEAELRQSLHPSTTDYSLRTSLWREYEEAVRLGKPRIILTDIFRGICSEQYFYGRVLKDPRRVAWLVRPLQAYAREMEAILNFGTQKLWEIMDCDIYDEVVVTKGKTKKARRVLNVKRAELVLKVQQEVANRVKGMALQRIKEQRTSKSTHVQVSASVTSPTSSGQPIAALKERLAQLEGRKIGGLPKALQLEPEEEPITIEVRKVEGEREIITVGPPAENKNLAGQS